MTLFYQDIISIFLQYTDLCLKSSVTVPAGAILVVPQQLVQMDHSVWGDDACQFNPQRFVSDPADQEGRIALCGAKHFSEFIFCSFLYSVDWTLNSWVYFIWPTYFFSSVLCTFVVSHKHQLQSHFFKMISYWFFSISINRNALLISYSVFV